MTHPIADRILSELTGLDGLPRLDDQGAEAILRFTRHLHRSQMALWQCLPVDVAERTRVLLTSCEMLNLDIDNLNKDLEESYWNV
jgi:hypothetical protein